MACRTRPGAELTHQAKKENTDKWTQEPSYATGGLCAFSRRKAMDATSVDEIAAAIGVAKGTIYYHFKGKRELFVASIKGGLRDLIDEAKAAVDRIGDPIEQLSCIFDTLLERQRKSKDFVYLLFKEAMAPGREWLEEISECWNELASLIST